MFRITEFNDWPDMGSHTLRVEGHLTEDCAAELAVARGRLGRNLHSLVLDLGGVNFIDAHGVDEVCRYIGLGANIRGSTPFVAELLKKCYG